MRYSFFDPQRDSGQVSDFLVEFKEAAESLVALLRKSNIKIVPYFSDSLPYFSSLSREEKESILSKINFLVKVYSSSISQIYSNQALVWRALKKLKMQIPNEIMGSIDDDDIVEIYDTQFIQQFCNLRFFEICSYSIEQLTCLPWTQLWERRPKDIEDLFEIAAVLSEEQKPIFLSNRHKVKEMSSPFQYEIDYELKAAAPVKNIQGDLVGFIVVEGSEVTGGALTAEEEEAYLKRYLYPLEMGANIRSLN
ncbi:MAG: hypothetical protein KDD33_06385 [Bdellovibrionales bacterium]|nr:hypothetical protein [Bdellovibrionales bacterium]